MKTKKTLGFCAMAFTLLACLFPRAGEAAGHIWSIEAYRDAETVDRDFADTRNNPLRINETFKIKVRLLNENWAQVRAGTEAAKPWTFHYTGTAGGEALAQTQLPRLGVWVSNKLKYADLDGAPTPAGPENAPDKHYFTDLVFKYTVKAGDLALPLQLANPSGNGPVSASPDAASGPYFLERGRGTAYNEPWGLKNEAGTECQLYFSDVPQQDPLVPPTPKQKWDFTDPGIYIQALDFDSNYADDEQTVWREVAAGTTTASPIDPALAIEGGAADAMDLYVWTKDASVAAVTAGGSVMSVQARTDRFGNSYQVGTLRVEGGATAPSFKILAADGAAGSTTEVYLAPTPTNVYDTAGTVLTNFIVRTVKVVTPPPPYVSVAFAEGASSSVVADQDYAAHKTVLRVSLSQAFTSPVTVTLKPQLVNPDAAADVWNYIGLSNYDEGTDAGAYLSRTVTATFQAGEKTADFPLLYVYALGADARTSAVTNGIRFAAAIEGDDQAAARAFFNGTFVSAVLHINQSKPVVTMPDAPYAEIQGGESFPFKVAVGDTFQALQGTYDVYWAETGSNYKKVLEGVQPEGGVITVNHNYLATGENIVSKVYVVSQDGRQSDPCAFTIQKVAAPRRLYGTFVGNDSGVFAEGATASVKVQFDPAFNLAEEAYVFLVPQGEDAAKYVESAYFSQKGVRIKNGDTAAAVTPTLTVLDGNAATEAGLDYAFVIRSENSLTTGQVIEGYGSDTITLIATNVVPRVESAKMGIWDVADGETCEGTASVGVTKQFSLTPDGAEVDADLYAGWGPDAEGVMSVTNEATAFRALWTFYDGAGFSTNVYGSPYQSVPYTFVNPGKVRVTVQLQDKDLRAAGENKFGPKFTFYVNVIDTPAVEITPTYGSTTFLESATDAPLDITLTEAAAHPIDVKLVLERGGADNGNYPIPQLSGSGLTSVDGEANAYILRFERGKTSKTVNLRQLDGTDATSATKGGDGFVVRATVITDTPNADGKPYSELYLAASETIYVDNEPPVVVMPDAADTNAYVTTIAKREVINWRVRDPSRIDLTNRYSSASWTGPGLKVTIQNSEGAFAEFWTTTGSGSYTNTFTSSGGNKWVSVQVEDKDGGSSETVKKYFEIPASKGVLIYPQRPFMGGGQSELASAYLSADGIGKGRVWAYTDAVPAISNFRHQWTYGQGSSTAELGASGYRAGALDNGTLNGGAGWAITPEGSRWTDAAGTGDASYYKYDSAYDSFLYAWILDTADGSGSFVGTALLAPQSGFNVSQRVFSLPEDEEDATSYVDTVIEAIFSREWRVADNLGDINQDGVPDVYATKKYDGGVLYQLVGSDGGDGSGAVSVNDLKGLWAYNGDGDAVPQAFNYSNPLNPMKPGWGPGQDFKAGWEIRGFHEGLNEPGVSDPDFSQAETMALFCDYLAAGNPNEATYDALHVAATNWAKQTGWNLERRTDPTKADTDDDGYDDGYEYFFWYMAKAGTIVDGQWRRLTGSRFNIATPGKGDPIPSEQIAAAFDPLSKHPEVQDDSLGWDVKDFDGDGLTDLEEYVLGTNPVNWDSDGDGMSDFYEVMNGTDPLDASDGTGAVLAKVNPDGDYMAYMTSTETFTVVRVQDEESGEEKVYAYPTRAGGISLAPGVRTVTETDPDTGDEVETEVPAEAAVWAATVVEGAERTPCFLAQEPVLVQDASGRTYLGVSATGYAQISAGDARYLGEAREFPAGTEVADVAAAAEPVSFAVTSGFMGGLPLFRYGDDKDFVWVPTVIDGQTMDEFFDENGDPAERAFPVLSYEENVNIAYIHHQVYQMEGFDPRTGWFDDGLGYVAARWHQKDSEKEGGEGETGKAVNTRPYTSRDEFLLLAYRFNVHDVTNAAGKVILARAHRDLASDAADIAGGGTKLGEYFTSALTKATPSGTDAAAADSTNAVAVASADVHGADSDEDGIPDGWELYVNLDPTNMNPPQSDGSWVDDPLADSDGLVAVEEYAGTDSCNAYKDVQSIYTNHPGLVKGWYNKFFPTDPMDADTDGDGLTDREEGQTWEANFYVGRNIYQANFTFIYGTNTAYLEDMETTCFRGGGLNPCTVDTDGDLLPDPWEWEFAGVVFDETGANDLLSESDAELLRRSDGLTDGKKPTGAYISGGMDGTWKGDAYTDMTSDDAKDPRTGTFRDTDWDHDGLQNYQEYLVQALRHLRYDDAETPLMGRYLVWQFNEAGPQGISPTVPFMGFTPMQTWDGDAFYQTCLEAGYRGNNSVFNYAYLGYFAPPPKAWDRLAQNAKGQKDCARYAVAGYRVMLRPKGLAPESGPDNPGSSVTRYVATGYASTDPRRWDSDDDGMDDYYELFHGLNPLLGSSQNPESGDLTTTTPSLGNGKDGTLTVLNSKYDRIATIYGLRITSWKNAWTFWDGATAPAFDPIRFPWMMGTAECDADGDGLRNSEEALTANLTSPTTSHTDPTPLWFTDSTSTNLASYVAQYYQFDPTWGNAADLCQCWDRPHLDLAQGAAQDGYDARWMFSFEENEGYDTDHDFLKDGDELVKRVTPASDPLAFTDPDRRQAMWFPGAASAAVSTLGTQQRPNALEYDLLRQFTVEAWIRPEVVSGREQVILERVANYGGSTLSNAADVVRANFRLGIREDGCVYGEFEGSTADSGAARVVGTRLEANAWTHVALSFSGTELRLYLNGEAAPVATASNVGLIPANGVTIMLGEAGGESFPAVKNGYATVPSAFVLGARALSGAAVTLGASSTWANYGSFYQGWLDEVRVWDGARTGTEINADYKARYTLADVKANRTEVYRSWANGARRNDALAGGVLPCELVQHYSFMALPGELDAADVMTEPAGFTKNVLDNVRVNGTAVDLRCGWWASVPVRSTVYDSATVVPWIQNTVAHLPPLDGSTWDSMYWNENLAGMSPCSDSGVSKFEFPNTANPYPYRRYFRERAYHSWYWARLASGSNSLYQAFVNLNAFDLRGGFVGTSDLVPLGGAFPKRVAEMWDGAGASDAWTVSKYDDDGDGLPDWWEEMYGDAADIDWDSDITVDGRVYKAWERYLRDLAKGLLSDGTFDEAYAANGKDVDKDGLPDWWEELVGIQGTGGDVGDALADNDNDQLNNYVEYLVAEGFSKYPGFPATLSPTAMRSDAANGQVVPDYFLPVGRLYLGEMFTDHDFVEDWWERLFDASFASQFSFDAQKDADDDGWSNFAEARYSQWRTLMTADLASRWLDIGDELRVAGRPEPALGVKVSYFGRQAVEGKPVVVRVSSAAAPNAADAIFTIPGAADVTEAQSGTQYIGPYRAGGVVHGHLQPGSLMPGGTHFTTTELSNGRTYQWNWNWYDERGLSHPLVYFGDLDTYVQYAMLYPYIEMENSSPVWKAFATTTSDVDGHFGQILYAGTNVTMTGTSIGTIDFRTGEYALDMTAVAKCETDAARLAAMLFRATYTYRISGDWPQTVYLSQPDSGYVREGKNYITAFIDLDGDGAWTPGEPFGAATPYGTDVGWWKTDVAIELTDTAPQMFRVNLAQAMAANDFESQKTLSDRGVNGSLSPNLDAGAQNTGTNMPAATESDVRVRIVRTAVNGVSRIVQNGTTKYVSGVVADLRLNPVKCPVLSEADILDAALDLDWDGGLVSVASSLGIAKQNILSAAYRVVVGNGTVQPTATNNALATLFVNLYDTGAAQPAAVPVAPQGTVREARPTFTWTHESAVGKSYPAFRLRVWKADGKTLVYDSGAQRAPARNAAGVYSWTAPISADMVTPQGVVFATTNNYQWSVSMLDAKFTTPNASETKRSFRLECSGAGGAASDYGAIDVCVKYFGPATLSHAPATTAGLVRVQAFTTPDFSGTPAAEAYVADGACVRSTTTNAVNCTLKGLSAGTYYVRAFIDTDGDGARSAWESYGYANYVGTEAESVYNPKPLVVKAGTVERPSATVYVEDQDTDDDGFPDVYEYEQYKSLETLGPASGNTFFTRVNPELKTALGAYTRLGDGASMLAATPFAAMLGLADGSGTEGLLAAARLLGVAPEQKTAKERVCVSIAGFSLADGIRLAVTSEATAAGSQYVTVDDASTVAVWLVAADSPAFSDAVSVKVRDVRIAANGATDVAIGAAELADAIERNGLGAKAFFKVRLVK